MPLFIPFQPGFTVHQFEGGTGRLFTNEATAIDNIYGTARLPFIWAVPKILDPNAIFSVQLTQTNTGEGVNDSARLTHNGYKVFGNFNLWKWEKQLIDTIQGVPQR